jgi:hypothetical protein
MEKRQPKLAALWLGAIISGMHMTIFQHVRLGLLAIELHASAWTATTHRFIGLRPRSPCVINSVEISRSDECRLLYLAEREDILGFQFHPGSHSAPHYYAILILMFVGTQRVIGITCDT